MEIQKLEHTDINFVSELLPQGWEDTLPIITAYTTTNYCYPVKVSVDKKIVGIGAAIFHKATAWLAHIVVHPDYRKQGIGQLITQTLVDAVHAKGCDTINLLATELGEPVYKKIGFEIECEYLIYKCEQTTGAVTNSEHIVASTNDFKKQIFNLDRQVSGEDRVLVLEPHLSNGFLYIHDNEVKGFYLPSLGHGLIIATTSAAGHKLMKLRLQSKNFASFPIENLSAREFMKQNNFNEVRTEKRMRLGKKLNWQPENIYAIIGGNLG